MLFSLGYFKCLVLKRSSNFIKQLFYHKFESSFAFLIRVGVLTDKGSLSCQDYVHRALNTIILNQVTSTFFF